MEGGGKGTHAKERKARSHVGECINESRRRLFPIQ